MYEVFSVATKPLCNSVLRPLVHLSVGPLVCPSVRILDLLGATYIVYTALFKFSVFNKILWGRCPKEKEIKRKKKKTKGKTRTEKKSQKARRRKTDSDGQRRTV